MRARNVEVLRGLDVTNKSVLQDSFVHITTKTLDCELPKFDKYVGETHGL